MLKQTKQTNRQTHLQQSQLTRNSMSIEDLSVVYEKYRKAFHQNTNTSLEYRLQRLKQLHSTILEYKTDLAVALDYDFGSRSMTETYLLEIGQTLEHLKYTIKNLKKWMKPIPREVPLHLQPGKAMLIPQPKGIIGIISPWNYPILLSLTPLITAIAAGNTALIKVSEYVPQTNNCLEKIIKKALDNKCACIIQGDETVADAFSALPFDHLFFTGSTRIGKKVMEKAARNLTPVTLELGGKSPVIIGKNYNIQKAAKKIALGKCLNAGQTCIAPDYILCPREIVNELREALADSFYTMYPTQAENDDYTAIISQSHFNRLQKLLQDAIEKGADVHSLSSDTDFCSTSKIPLTLLTNTTDNMNIMQEEIFGPLLPIIPIDSMSEALNYIQTRPHPLALYLMSDNPKTHDLVIKNTHSGGICINDVLTHVAVHSLPFGGIRHSGIGRYHGKEGFYELSHLKSVFKRGKINPASFITPPWNEKINILIQKLFL
ncbi:MAG TPA: coniferyl-aldehyde dehydrogenase [Gammaproteobacteria bacterium]|nr:coniferyl-aldehyde dehydrogenase [Gammaproteobacteria bacterium]